ncbi:MAG: signal peptide peptidase SppA [Spirochaetales bacterium]|nr:signal peptide peptidase SppA [Spirochaetales bacterium]|tara:strand:+ start:1495 stop:2349 length:855 start_codon:yes stop_codon:yes gene_type:complete
MNNMKYFSLKNLVIVAVLALFVYSAFVTVNPTDKIAVLEVNGIIKNPKKYLDSIRKIKDNEAIKGMIVRINSPGGTVGSSQEIYSSLVDLNKSIPVVSSIVDVGASGGYLVACGSSYIFANSGSITGSIGVISQYYDISELMKFLKLDVEIIKSGRLKDMGNPTKKLRDDERKLLNALLKDVHGQFQLVVQERRGLTDREIKNISDGRIFSGNQALKLKLIDGIGGLESAKEYIEKKIELYDLELEYFPKRKRKFFDRILPELDSEDLGVRFIKKLYYLYSPDF